MASFNYRKFKNIVIDGEARQVPDTARIIDVVDEDVVSIETINPQTSKFELITRDQFNQDVKPEMTTNLTAIAKGGVI
ncbi:hypothetical protein [Aeromonas caviae]|uniref:hypothetical protein n=1 Tax=Aeromonas caviae TaxID=648 RepID=UPI0029D9E0D3|nr:hypothetical protein [Aeromonas caviae]MDX7710650.1 hypothetical protein [Aeromonas caviae]MDX7717468.1 hypothetical protein [Aeromonas caviae]MDX7860006.1 hypothetical protein [Aeromonas caviae]